MNQGSSFLPDDFVAASRVRRTSMLAAALFPVMILAVFAAFLVTNRQWNAVRAAQALVDGETERAALEIAEMKSLEKIRGQMNAKAELARGLLEPVPRSVLLAVLVNTMPARVALTSIELRTEVIKPVKTDSKPDPKAAARTDAKTDAKIDAKTRAARAADAKARKGGSPGEAAPEPVRRRTHVTLVGLAPSLLEVGRWMTALEQVPVFSAVRLELMEERAIEGRDLSEFRIAIRIEPDADLRAWEELPVFRSGRLPDAVAASLGESAHDAREDQR